MPLPCPHCGKAIEITAAEVELKRVLPTIYNPTRVDALAKMMKCKSAEVVRLYTAAGHEVLADGPSYGDGLRRRRVHPK